MERWERERAIGDAQARIDGLRQEREEILEFEREVTCGRNEFLSQLEYRRSCARRMGDVAHNGLALRISSQFEEGQDGSFERRVTDSFEGARLRAEMLLQNIDNGIAREQACIDGHLDALAQEDGEAS